MGSAAAWGFGGQWALGAGFGVVCDWLRAASLTGHCCSPCYQNPAIGAQHAGIVQIFPILYQSSILQKTVHREALTCSTEVCEVLEETVNFKEELFDE